MATLLMPIALPISNVFLLKGDRSILIDTGRPRDADAIARALSPRRILPGHGGPLDPERVKRWLR